MDKQGESGGDRAGEAADYHKEKTNGIQVREIYISFIQTGYYSLKKKRLVSPMSLSQSPQSPLARLVLFMVCLAIAGSFGAGAHYYAVDVPQQNTVQAPENAANSFYICLTCKANCGKQADIYDCQSQCELVC